MAVKIRLQRRGRKGRPIYAIVAADARAKRDGRFLEKLGVYNPHTNPATVDLNVDAAVRWLQQGAQPTDTAKSLLSYKGALLKKHLQTGVNKGAITQEQADEKFATWLSEKEASINAKKERLDKEKTTKREAALATEKATNEKRQAAREEVESEENTEEATAEDSEA